MGKKGKTGAPPRKKKDRGFGMRELRMGIKPVRKYWEYDFFKANKSQITKIKRFSDGRVFVDYPDGRKVVRMPDGTERERCL
jgi:hypothetical protein